jgi:hypothetical protein
MASNCKQEAKTRSRLPPNHRPKRLTLLDILAQPHCTREILLCLAQRDCHYLRHVSRTVCALLPGHILFSILRVTPRQITPQRNLSESTLRTIAPHAEELQISFQPARSGIAPDLSIPPGRVLSEAYEWRGSEEVEVKILDSGSRLLESFFAGVASPPPVSNLEEEYYTKHSDWPLIFRFLHPLATLSIRTPRHPGGLEFTPTSRMLTALRIGFEEATFMGALQTLKLAPMHVTYLTQFCGLGSAFCRAHWTAEKMWGRIQNLELQLITQGGQETSGMQWMQTVKILQRWLKTFGKNLRILRWHWIGAERGRIPHPLALESAIPVIREPVREPAMVWHELRELWVGNVDKEELDLEPLFSSRTPELEKYYTLWNTEASKLVAFDVGAEGREEWNCVDVSKLHVLSLKRKRGSPHVSEFTDSHENSPILEKVIPAAPVKDLPKPVIPGPHQPDIQGSPDTSPIVEKPISAPLSKGLLTPVSPGHNDTSPILEKLVPAPLAIRKAPPSVPRETQSAPPPPPPPPRPALAPAPLTESNLARLVRNHLRDEASEVFENVPLVSPVTQHSGPVFSPSDNSCQPFCSASQARRHQPKIESIPESEDEEFADYRFREGSQRGYRQMLMNTNTLSQRDVRYGLISPRPVPTSPQSVDSSQSHTLREGGQQGHRQMMHTDTRPQTDISLISLRNALTSPHSIPTSPDYFSQQRRQQRHTHEIPTNITTQAARRQNPTSPKILCSTTNQPSQRGYAQLINPNPISHTENTPPGPTSPYSINPTTPQTMDPTSPNSQTSKTSLASPGSGKGWFRVKRGAQSEKGEESAGKGEKKRKNSWLERLEMMGRDC